MTIDTYAELDALAITTPNLAAVQLAATLRGITFQQAMIAQAREWCTALDEAIDRHAQEAAYNIGHAEHLATTAEQRRAWHREAAEHLDEVNRLTEIRTVAAQMLADADTNPVDQASTNPR